MDSYKIFDEMNDVGSTYDTLLHDLRTQGLLLRGWEQSWGFGSDSNYQRLDPEDFRYRYATASLVRIVAVFASIDKLQAKYRIVVKKESIVVEARGGKHKGRLRDRLSISIPLRFRPKSPSPSTTTAEIAIAG
ncbi:hypothetical protein EV426DRAFT_703249 [Tirmania nivea]|nr:hypothetical protein EV426DRAFT_703241 [Tirmania nivea]KAF8416902.1 hypothetical protein EV426DRAFT_703249 [Tirmania nivea]